MRVVVVVWTEFCVCVIVLTRFLILINVLIENLDPTQVDFIHRTIKLRCWSGSGLRVGGKIDLNDFLKGLLM